MSHIYISIYIYNLYITYIYIIHTCCHLWISVGQHLFRHWGLENDGELLHKPEKTEFRCASFWRGLGGSIPS